MAITAIRNIKNPYFATQNKIKDVQTTSNQAPVKRQNNQKTEKQKRNEMILGITVLLASAALVTIIALKGRKTTGTNKPGLEEDSNIFFVPVHDDNTSIIDNVFQDVGVDDFDIGDF